MIEARLADGELERRRELIKAAADARALDVLPDGLVSCSTRVSGGFRTRRSA